MASEFRRSLVGSEVGIGDRPKEFLKRQRKSLIQTIASGLPPATKLATDTQLFASCLLKRVMIYLGYDTGIMASKARLVYGTSRIL